MKKYLAAAFVFTLLSGSLAARADVTINETDGFYNLTGVTGTIVNGAHGSADTFQFDMASFGVSISIDLTDASGLVLDTIFSPGGPAPSEGAFPADAFQFAGINSRNAAIGTLCVASESVACVVRTGGVQDLTSVVASLNGGQGIYAGEEDEVVPVFTVQADDIASPVPEPSSLMLLGTGIGAFGMARRRFTRAA